MVSPGDDELVGVGLGWQLDQRASFYGSFLYIEENRVAHRPTTTQRKCDVTIRETDFGSMPKR